MALIADPDDFYMEELHQPQKMMLMDIKYNLSEHYLLYGEFKDIIDNTLERNTYRVKDRDELNIIRKRFLEKKYE